MPQERVEPTLVGRSAECTLLAGLVRGDGASRVALVHGEAGIGKTSILRWALEQAGRGGSHALTARGVPSESGLPFAGLHHLLRPLLGRDPALDGRAAVHAALTAPEAAGEAIMRTGLAVLELLAEAARRRPLVIVVDDVQWWDRPSRHALTFVARRLGEDPIVLLVAARDPVPAELEQIALGDHWLRLTLGRLDDEDAIALLDSVAPGLEPAVRRRVLVEAAGNPLALRELPHTIGRGTADRTVQPVPVNDRLTAAFAARLAAVPEVTRSLLVVAAAHESDDLGELLAAGAAVCGRPVALHDLEPAVAAGLLEASPGVVRFDHPLARSAVYQHAGPAARQAAHSALAEVVRSADRRAWHAAAAAAGPDESVAEQLDEVAERADHFGAKDIALHALEEAARLSESPTRRAARTLRAVELSAALGVHERTLELLGQVDAGALDAADRPWLDWLRELLEGEPWTGADRVATFADIASRLAETGRRGRAMQMLEGIALRCWWSDLDPAVGGRVAATADQLAAGPDDPEHLSVVALAAPVERGRQALRVLERIGVTELYPDTTRLLDVALAGTAVGDHPRSIPFFMAAIAEARRKGQTGLLTQALVALAWAETHLGRLSRAEVAGEEAVRLARETEQPLWLATGRLALAAARGLRGREGDTEALAGEAERIYIAAGANPMLAQVQAARGLVALGAGRYDEALAQLSRVFSPSDPSYHSHFRTFLVSEVAEAAARAARHDLGRRLLDEAEPVLAAAGSPILRAGVLVARLLLAEEAAVEERYEDAVADGLAAWPLHRGRALLAYGAWLRRRRRIVEAREVLRTARETLDATGATHWADRAAEELRAAGGADRTRAAAAWEVLTPQELQIAQLAAEGLTNRQIGERLFLSHRTVSAHLYHVFPKLGISSRAQLRQALEGASVTGGVV